MTIDELIVGHTYTLKSGDKMKVLRYIPPLDKNPYDRPAYEVEAGGKTWVHSEEMLKRLEYKEQD